MGTFLNFTCTSALESPIQADLILLSFSLLHFADTMGGGGLFVYKLKVYGNPASNKLSAPFFQQHWLTLQFKLFHYYYLCYGHP